MMMCCPRHVEEAGNTEWNLPARTKLQLGLDRKAEGNALFSKGSYVRALDAYDRGRQLFELLYGMDPDEKDEAVKLRRALDLNRAACHLKLKAYKPAKAICAAIIDEDPSMVKAWFRRGQAWVGLLEYDAAKSDLEKALEIDADNAGVKKELARLAKLVSAHRKREMQMFNNMFG